MKVFGRPDAPEGVAVFAFPTFNQDLIFVPAKLLICTLAGRDLDLCPTFSSNQPPEALLMPTHSSTPAPPVESTQAGNSG